MATIDQLHTALVNADAAGDTAAATALAAEIQRVNSTPTNAAPAAPTAPQEAPPLMARVGRGFMDVGQGLKQLYLLATDKDAAQKYTADKNQEEALYEKGRGPDAGIDWGRLGGNVAAGTVLAAPALAALPEAAGATVLGRVATQAGIGGLTGGAQFSPEGTATSKLMQTGVGAVAGGATQGAGEAAAPFLGKVVQKASEVYQGLKNQVTGQVKPEAVAAGIRAAMPEFDQMPPAQQKSVIDQAIAQRFNGQTTDPAALARVADAKSIGVDLTQGQASRNARAFGAEQEASKLQGVGDPLQTTFVDQNNQLLGQIPKMQQASGGEASSAYEAAERAREAVQDFADASQKKVGALYDTAKKTVGVGSEVPLAPIAHAIGEVGDEYGVEHLAGAVGNRLKSYGLMDGEQTKSLDVAGAEQLRKFIGNNIDPSNPAQTAALKKVQGAIDASVSTLGEGLGGDAGQAFRDARAAASQRFQALSPTPVKRLMQTGEAAPNFLQTNVLGGKPGELAGLKSVVMQSNPQAWDDIRRQTLQHLADKATMGDAQGLFSGARFGKALDAIGMDRLRVLFSPEELNHLGAIKRTAYNVTVAPPKSNINNSNTASTLSNLMQSQAAGPGLVGRAIGMIPGLGHMAVGGYQAGREALQQQAMRSAVQTAASPGAAAFSTPPIGSEAARKLVARLLMRPGLAAGPGGAYGLGALNSPQTGP
jgi:hypothetical protein